MSKYSTELKLEAIEAWKERILSTNEIINKYNISHQTLRRWIYEYNSDGVDGIVRKPTNSTYTGEFKQTVVEDMRKNGLSQSETSRKYSIGRSQVQQWERIYLEDGVEWLYVDKRGRAFNSINAKPKNILNKNVEEDLITENQHLRMENEYFKKLNVLIQVKEK